MSSTEPENNLIIKTFPVSKMSLMIQNLPHPCHLCLLALSSSEHKGRQYLYFTSLQLKGHRSSLQPSSPETTSTSLLCTHHEIFFISTGLTSPLGNEYMADSVEGQIRVQADYFLLYKRKQGCHMPCAHCA